MINQKIIMAARPVGEPRESDFALVESEISAPGPGQVLVRTIYLSLDPYMRGRMSAAKSYAASLAVGDTIVGGTVGIVAASENPRFAIGDHVLNFGGWQSYSLSDGKDLRKLDRAQAPLSTALGVLGMPGMTAYTGLLNIGQPKPGETVVVAAAAGPVGSLVGQIARLKGARAVGIAGGRDKCDYVTGELGFDACLDHRGADLPAALAEACPNGIDVYFENVGGAVLDAVIPLLNPFARMPVCGLVSQYNATGLPEGPNRLPGLMRAVLTQRLTLRGFIVTDFAAQGPEFAAEVGGWLRAGQIKYREDVTEGLANAPAAFIGLLAGRNFGKAIVRVGPED